MRVVVAGDAHGALDALFEAVGAIERERGPVAAVLQVGDFGVFPDPRRLDPATRKAARTDPATALGFLPYHRGDRNAPWPVLFVRGNHEDFEFLAPRRNATVDAAERIVQIGDGRVWEVTPEGVRILDADEVAKPRGVDGLHVAGLGGIDPVIVGEEKRKALTGTRYVDPHEIAALEALPRGSVDVLLAHEAPWGFGLRGRPATGSRIVTRIVEHLRPRWMLFGHYDDPPQPVRTFEGTVVAGTNGRRAWHYSADGGLGVLETEGGVFELLMEAPAGLGSRLSGEGRPAPHGATEQRSNGDDRG